MAGMESNKCIYSFNQTPSCNNAVQWANDGRLAIATDESVLITELENSPNQLVSSTCFHIKSIPAWKEQNNLSGLDENQFKELQDKTESQDLKQELALDHTLCPLLKTPSLHTGYRAISWSPVGGDPLGRCILATISHDHRVLLYSCLESQWNWKVVCNLSQLYLKTSEWKNSIVDDIHSLKTRMYCLSALEMAWTSHSDTKSAILSVAMRNGNILLWLIKFPCQSEEDCTLLKTLNFDSTYPSSITWPQTPVVWSSAAVDLIGVGFQNGCLHLAAIDMNNGSLLSSICLHSDQDLLSVNCLCVKKFSEDQWIVLAAKESYLMTYIVTVTNRSLRLQHSSITTVETSLYITGLCYKTDVLLVCTHDGLLYRGNVSVSSKDVSVELNKWELATDETDKEGTWQYHGVDISSHFMLMAIITFSSRNNFGVVKIKMCKKPFNLLIQPILSDGDNQVELLQTKVETLIKEESIPCIMMTDVMEIFRKYLWQGKNLAPSVTDHISNPQSWYTLPNKTLQVLRYFLITISLHIPRNPDTTETNEEVALAEKNIENVGDVIMGKYICDSLEQLLKCKNTIKAKDKGVCSSMMLYMDHRKEKYVNTPLRARFEVAKQSLGQYVSDGNCCSICGGKSTISEKYNITCEDGHVLGLCCQTLQPCVDPQYRICGGCKVLAVPYTARLDLPWLAGVAKQCTICGGYLFPCT